jgi:hypothetical protein
MEDQVNLEDQLLVDQVEVPQVMEALLQVLEALDQLRTLEEQVQLAL